MEPNDLTVSPELILVAGTDPTPWTLQSANYLAVSAQLGQATGPVLLPVRAPLTGTMVLSVRSAGSIWFGPPAGGTGTHPTDVRGPAQPPCLYLSTQTGLSRGNPGYPLAPGTDLAALTQEIVTAMTEGTALTVPVATLGGIGFVVLSGASLAYAVLADPT